MTDATFKLYGGRVSGREMVRLLRQHGWVLDRISGSHHIMTKAGHRPIAVPVHGSKDLAKGLVHHILKEAGIQ